MKEHYISPNYKVEVYYQLPYIDSYLSDAEWKTFTIMFNRIMTCTKHDKIKSNYIQMTYEWIAKKCNKSTKTIQRSVSKLIDLGIIKVCQMDYKPNSYQLNWDVINTLARCQYEDKDKNEALEEVKDDLYLEDIFVSPTEDRFVPYVEDRFVPPTEDKNVPQIIKGKNKEYNKNKNKGNNTSTGTTPKSIRVSATELDGVAEKVFSSFQGNKLANARFGSEKSPKAKAINSSSFVEDQSQLNPISRRETTSKASHSSSCVKNRSQHSSNVSSETTAADTHSSFVGETAEASKSNNLQSAPVSASHPPIAPTPLSPQEEKVLRICDKFYNHGNDYNFSKLESTCEFLERLIETEDPIYNEEVLSKVQTTAAYLRYGIEYGFY